MTKKPEQYHDTRRHQLYYQWSESEYFSYQEPIYDRTREYIESLEAENAKLRELFTETLIRLVAASEAAGGGFMDDRYCELLESHGIEVVDE